MRQKRQAITRAEARRRNFIRPQAANAGTAARPVAGHVLGPQNQHWAQLEGGVQRPAWLRPQAPNWFNTAKNIVKYGGLGGAIAATGYELLSGYWTPKDTNRKPQSGYLDRLYPKKYKPFEAKNLYQVAKMAPIRKKYVRRGRKRLRTVRRRYRKRALRAVRRRRVYKGRRRSRRSSPLIRAIKRSSKFIKMGHYTMPDRFRKCCDVIDIADFECTPGSVDAISGVAKIHDLSFKIDNLANLKDLLTGGTKDDFSEFRIDKIVYKVTCLNARNLQMDPNFKPPDGTGQDALTTPSVVMANKWDYVPNSYVFIKRFQNDPLTNADFTDWSLIRRSDKGVATFQNFFRQRGKMYNMPIIVDRADEIYMNSTAVTRKRHGTALGWQTYSAGIMDLRIGAGALIMPGIFPKGWDNTIMNIKPKLRITARICSSVRCNVKSLYPY
ncbi:MAG: hypothetical protein IV298_16140 [Cylindrospermopsis raciborskii KL1]|uniref:hypothetical protein n=1 Tax=Cylindrospermopsis raciborskii TaxID=77022 RepID=UPI001A1ED778|nr:hypothetical protein [Cylindrospermopsis raciborskii]MBG0744959.1 hypothetical protein [Cylindrospermopsis raciborskii KL1]